MKKNYLSCLVFAITGGILFFVSNEALGVGKLIQLSAATYNRTGNDDAYGVAVDNSGNIFIAGGVANAPSDLFVIKYDNNLTVISSVTYNSSAFDLAGGVAADNSGNVFIAGLRHNGANFDFLTIKYDNNLTYVSSFTYNGSGNDHDIARGVAVDNSGNIIVTGGVFVSNDDWFTVKLDNDLAFISSITYNSSVNNADAATGVAIDNSGNIFVTGYSHNGANYDYLTIKYDTNLNVLSSTTYNGSSNNTDQAYGVAVDTSGNVFITGQSSIDSKDRYFTIKYDNNLTVISSTSYLASGDTSGKGNGITVDNSGNIIVAGASASSGDDFWTTLVYNNSLQLISSATYTVDVSETAEEALAVAVDNSGNIVVAGYTLGSSKDMRVVKYLGKPTVSSVSTSSVIQGQTIDITITGTNFYDGATVAFSGSGIAVSTHTVDLSNQISVTIAVSSSASLGSRDVIVTNTDEQSGSKSSAIEILGPAVNSVTPSSGLQGETINLTVSGENFISTPTVTLSGTGITVNSVTYTNSTTLVTNITISADAALGARNITATNPGGSSATKEEAFTIVESEDDVEVTTPTVSGISPESGALGETLDVTITGTNFVDTPTVTASGEGITLNSITYESSTKLVLNVTISTRAIAGARDVTVTNPGGGAVTKTAGFTIIYPVSKGITIDRTQETNTTFQAETGDIVLLLPAGTFSQDISLTISTLSDIPVTNQGTLTKINVGIEITPSVDIQPDKEFTITIYYRDSDVEGIDETKIVVGRYDTTTSRWVLLPSVCYPDINCVEATVDHLSQFAVLQKTPAATLGSVIAYPNPYKPKTHTAGLTFDYLTSNAKIKIYNVAGELVKEIEETDGDGIAVWDGKNKSGNLVASGVYIAYIKSDNSTKKVKIAVIK
ncbi:MAG: SBBP repeat-containing protein [Endomicrobiales bacterium]|nr:SBBP repeat-containing protein [Endomicrobiales bacterium]